MESSALQFFLKIIARQYLSQQHCFPYTIKTILGTWSFDSRASSLHTWISEMPLSELHFLRIIASRDLVQQHCFPL